MDNLNRTLRRCLQPLAVFLTIIWTIFVCYTATSFLMFLGGICVGFLTIAPLWGVVCKSEDNM